MLPHTAPSRFLLISFACRRDAYYLAFEKEHLQVAEQLVMYACNITEIIQP